MASRLMSPELKAVFRQRLRHIHLPDRAPHYTPRALPGNLRAFFEDKIKRQRSVAARLIEEPEEAQHDVDPTVAAMRAWLREASPPPTVISFTRRPTYVLPTKETRTAAPWELEYLTAALKSPQRPVFPTPPDWDPSPYQDAWDSAQNPLDHESAPGVLSMPCAEPMYFGPGQISIWPVIDLLDNVQRGKKFSTKYEYARILEDTTIQVLKREYGLDAFTIPGKTGVWVESLLPPPELSDSDEFGIKSYDHIPPKKYEKTRRIATIHVDLVDDITRFGVSIHVSQPARVNPWIPLRQDSITTSIAAELALKGSAPQPTDPEQQELLHRSDKKSLYLQTKFDEDSSFTVTPLLAMPYSLVALQRGLRQPTPMGLDNRDLSSAWTYEFARQLGFTAGVVDHLSMVDFGPRITALPHKTPSRIGFRARAVTAEDLVEEPFKQVEVPSIQLEVRGDVTQDLINETRRMEGKDRTIPGFVSEATMARSWPLYYKRLTDLLWKAFRGRAWDTRLTQLIRDRAEEASVAHRLKAIDAADDLRDKWRNHQNPAIYRKGSRLTQLMAEITSKVRDMKTLLASLQAGRVTIAKRRLEAKTTNLEELVQALQPGNASSQANPTDTDTTSKGQTVLFWQEIMQKSKAMEKAAESTDTATESWDTSALRERMQEVIGVAQRALEALDAEQRVSIADAKTNEAVQINEAVQTNEAIQAQEAIPSEPDALYPQFPRFTPTWAQRRIAAEKRRIEQIKERIAKLQQISPTAEEPPLPALARPPGRYFQEFTLTRNQALARFVESSEKPPLTPVTQSPGSELREITPTRKAARARQLAAKRGAKTAAARDARLLESSTGGEETDLLKVGPFAVRKVIGMVEVRETADEVKASEKESTDKSTTDKESTLDVPPQGFQYISSEELASAGKEVEGPEADSRDDLVESVLSAGMDPGPGLKGFADAGKKAEEPAGGKHRIEEPIVEKQLEEPKPEDPKPEKPKPEKPKPEEPKPEEPKPEPKPEELKAEEQLEEPKAEEPKAEAPMAEGSKVEEGKADESNGEEIRAK